MKADYLLTEGEGNDQDQGALMSISADKLIELAKVAQARIQAVKDIKRMALEITDAGDWVDENGKPYLQASGAEKVAGLFDINWTIDEPSVEPEESGHFTYTYHGHFTMAGRKITAVGSRSSKDGFFKKYEWINGAGGKREKVEKPISAIDRRDVKMAAYSNLMGNGITRILGIRNLTYEDLEKYAHIKKTDITSVEYKKEGQAGGKRDGKQNGSTSQDEQTASFSVKSVEERKREGKAPFWHVISDAETKYLLFNAAIAEILKKEIGTGLLVQAKVKKTQYGLQINEVALGEAPPKEGDKEQDGDPGPEKE